MFVSQYMKNENKKALQKVMMELTMILTITMMLTCSVLRITKSHAKTVVFSFTANRPTTQVTPSKGRRITVPFTPVLKCYSILH